MKQTLNPSRINPTETAVYVGGKKTEVTRDQIFGTKPTDGIKYPARINLISLGLIWPIGDVKPEWLEDAKRLMVVMKKAVEVGLVPKMLYHYLADYIATKACESYREQEAFTDEIRKREAEVEAKHGIKNGYKEWAFIGEGPPEWQEIQAEISRTFKRLFLDALNSLDSDLPAVFERKGWGQGSAEDSGEQDAIDLYAKKFFSGETIGY